jgi:hypothetical protein
MNEVFYFSDNQSYSNLSTTGAISTYYWDLENRASGSAIGQVDMSLVGYLNVIITSVSYTSGGTEGIYLRLLTDDATSLDTTRTTAGAGFRVICCYQVEYIDIVAGRTYSIPVCEEVCKQYVGFWPVAVSTTYTGTLKFDANFSSEPESSILRRGQKKPNTSFG